jgi:4-amino-4-deoxy-L-arabinose transferase-like glycosyltransferase
VAGDIDQRRRYSATTLVLALFFFSVLLALHIPLLHLPYFWDEAGYYVPAARDLLLHGTLIPHSTLSNAHPPLVIAYLALAWKVLGYAPWVARTAMLAVAAFSLLGIFRLAQRVANTEIAVGAAICTALYPVFFAQSSLAHLDLAAAGLTFWGLLAYVEDRRSTAALWFCMAVLAKETAVLAPLALLVWDLIKRLHARIGPASASQASVVIPDVPVVTPKVASVIPITPVVIPSEARDLGFFGCGRKPRFLVASLLGMTEMNLRIKAHSLGFVA